MLIQWGTNYIYPPIATAAHVTKSPNHQTGRESSLKFRFDVAIGGRLGLELHPDDLEDDEIIFAKEAIENYKLIRPIIQFGDLYRLQSPYDSDGYMAISYVSEDKEKSVLMVYSQTHHRREERNFLRMKGLDENAMYLVREINCTRKNSSISFNNEVVSGSVLMNVGFKVDLRMPQESAVFQFQVVSRF